MPAAHDRLAHLRTLQAAAVLLGQLLAAGIVHVAPSVRASDDLAYARTPAALIQEIERRSASEVVLELWGSGSWRATMDRIKEGRRDWLKAALVLRAGTDAGSSDELDEMMSAALLPNAEGVLEIIIPKASTPAICSGSVEFDNFVDALRELNAKIASVRAVSPTKLADARDRCLAALAESEKRLRMFYGEREK